MKKLFRSRFSALFSVLALYIILSFVVRIILLLWSVGDADLNLFYILRAFFTGFCYDLTIGTLFLFLYAVYLLIFPKKWIGSMFDKCFTYFYLTLIFIIIYFSLLAEIPFWDEFGVRFNFIAVDYLIYTYEVVSNINQSYPLPVIGVVLIGLIVSTFFIFKKLTIFKETFSNKISISKRLLFAVPVLAIAVILGLVMKNKQSDFSNNLVMNEVGKNGAFSFVTAFKSNELDY
ncbi:MAG: LTA synthase family protein, partial [Chryseobacterium gambrini]|nr:LTA synthase family protein [Chryseobacterium gambrini]